MKKNIVLLLMTIIFLSCSDSDSESVIEITLPVQTQVILSVLEYTGNGTVIGNLELPTVASNYKLSIVSQEPSNSFSINNSSGDILVRNSDYYDHDLRNEITGKIKIELDGLEKILDIIIKINDDYRVYESSIQIESQAMLESFALNKYDEIKGQLGLYSNQITNVDCLYTLKAAYSLIVANTKIKNLDSLKNLKILNGGPSSVLSGLFLKDNLDLENLEGFVNLTSSGSFIIDNNDKLTNLTGLENAADYKTLFIDSNENLLNLEGLNPPQKNMEWIHINYNSSLQNINKLTNVAFVEINVYIAYNNSLESVKLSNLVQTQRIEVSNNLILNDLCGLTTFFSQNPNFTNYTIDANAYNPTAQQIVAGNCSN